MKVLAFDASTDLLCLGLDAPRASFSCVVGSGNGQAERLAPLIESALERCSLGAKDLDLVVCASGPGSFTGLRIALATAKGLCAGSGVPLVTVPTLDYLARPFAHSSDTVVPVIDAKKGRVYSGIYRSGSLCGEYLDIPFLELLARLEGEEGVVFTGPDASLGEESSLARPGWRVDPDCRRPSAAALAEAGITAFESRGADSPAASPLYLRVSEEDLGITRPRASGHAARGA